jgi:gliding motility-associated transport system ATP-binding protein
VIEVEGLTKCFGPIAAVQDLSFRVEPGEIIGFLGPNGAGKTTTMRVLTGFFPPTSGKARIADLDVSEKPLEVKRRVGYLPESVPLYREMLVSRFLDYVATVKRIPRKQRRSEVGKVVEQCGLGGMSKRTIGNLSKGYRQRVGLAQALLGSPPVLILDEPTVGLDPKQIIEIRELIKGLAPEHTVLLSTHILPEVAMICERVIIINNGRIVAQDSMTNLSGGGLMRLEIEAGGNKADVLALLNKMDEVTEAVADRPGHYLVEVSASDRSAINELLNRMPRAKDRSGADAGQAAAAGDPAAGIARALVKGGFALHRLERRHRTLEDVFISAISSSSAPEDAG